ncbi:MAG: fibronectin type III domain-containing protein, partial [Limisphaerales bacterium]
RNYMMEVRDTLKPTYGFRYNSAWDITGLAGSIAIPMSRARLLPILSGFRIFLTGKPGLHDAEKGITPARVLELYNELDEANGEVQAQVTAVGNLLNARKTATRKLRHRVRATILTLTDLLGPMDMRWETFRLKRPGIKVRPPTPQGVTAILIGPTAVSVKWNRAARAEYYRIRKMVVGVDADWVPLANPADLDYTLENLTPNSTLHITVAAVNNGGESAPSEVAVVNTL